MKRRCQTHFHLAHYTDALFRSHEERLNSNEWQSAMRLRKHKVPNSLILIKRLCLVKRQSQVTLIAVTYYDHGIVDFTDCRVGSTH